MWNAMGWREAATQACLCRYCILGRAADCGVGMGAHTRTHSNGSGGLFAVCIYAFFVKINANVPCKVCRNEASMRVLRKSGFTLEAVHKCGVVKRGRVFDVHMHALLRAPLDVADYERRIG